jgi:hypothetical protein
MIHPKLAETVHSPQKNVWAATWAFPKLEFWWSLHLGGRRIREGHRNRLQAFYSQDTVKLVLLKVRVLWRIVAFYEPSGFGENTLQWTQISYCRARLG